MCVWVCVWIWEYRVCVWVYMWVCKCASECVSVCMWVWVYVDMCVCICVRTHIHMRAWAHTNSRMCAPMCGWLKGLLSVPWPHRDAPFLPLLLLKCLEISVLTYEKFLANFSFLLNFWFPNLHFSDQFASSLLGNQLLMLRRFAQNEKPMWISYQCTVWKYTRLQDNGMSTGVLPPTARDGPPWFSPDQTQDIVHWMPRCKACILLLPWLQ